LSFLCEADFSLFPSFRNSACKKGYTRSGNQCNLNTSVKTTSRVATSNVQLAAVSSSNLSGVKSFLGLNTGAIASWYHTNSAQDSTNGNSWCYYPYRDSTPGFAISLGAMLADAGGDATRAREMYCGLEAVVTTPSGKTLTLYVADAFDDACVFSFSFYFLSSSSLRLPFRH
jgi:hypothetical protein